MCSIRLLRPLVDRTGPCEIPSLCSEIARITQTIDASKQQLNGPVSSARGIARKLMSRQLYLVICQTTLATPSTQITSAGESTAVVFGMVGGIKVIARVFLEALLTVPGHILKGDQGAVGREEEVKVPDANDGIVEGLDNMSKDAILRGPK